MRSYTGIVQVGSRRASELGYPTINLSIDAPDVSGVFAARVTLPDGEERDAAAFGDPSRKLLEAHVFEYDREIYGSEATITLHKKIRDSVRFDSDDALKRAIADDVAKVREYFKN